MSVYIKGMTAPRSCAKCQLVTQYYDGGEDVCRLLDKYAPRQGKLDDCPLVLVPEHGDLIDRDKLERDIERYVGGEETRSRFHHWVQVQRTVIPESKEART